MLDLNAFDIDSIGVGETRRFNHTDCEAGEDRRQRLYITRPASDPTKVVGYCHNCQQGGANGDASYVKFRNDRHSSGSIPTYTIKDEITEPEGLVYEAASWPTYGKAWAYPNLPIALAQDYGIAYDPNSDRVFLPRYDMYRPGVRGMLTGYQLRSINGQQPKYLSCYNPDADPWTMLVPSYSDNDWAVIVEDLASGLHILRAWEEYDDHDTNRPYVFVNYGVKIDPTLMHHLASNYYWICIWLDNDNVHVNNASAKMAQTIKLYNPEARVMRVTQATDPKHYECPEIREIMEDKAYG